MEQQIQDLVDSIRKEGIDEANRERDSIISKAQKEADRIIAEARANASKMIEDATKECELRNQSAKASLSQAARDVSLSLKASIEKLLAGILSADIASAMDEKLLSQLVLRAGEKCTGDVDFEISGPDAQKIAAALKSQLRDRLVSGSGITVGEGYEGLHIVSKDGSGYIDLSADQIAAVLRPHLSQAVKAEIFD